VYNELNKTLHLIVATITLRNSFVHASERWSSFCKIIAFPHLRSKQCDIYKSKTENIAIQIIIYQCTFYISIGYT